jgi:hypothetical protein
MNITALALVVVVGLAACSTLFGYCLAKLLECHRRDMELEL